MHLRFLKGEAEFSKPLIRKGNSLGNTGSVKKCVMYKMIPNSLIYQLPTSYRYLENFVKLIKMTGCHRKNFHIWESQVMFNIGPKLVEKFLDLL